MKKTVISFCGLVDLKAMNSVIKKTDIIVWKHSEEENIDYIANSHWAAAFCVPKDSDLFATLCGMFGGVPASEQRLNIQQRTISDSRLEWHKLLNMETRAICTDTKLTFARDAKTDLRVFESEDKAGKCFVFANKIYCNMIVNGSIKQEKASGKHGILFESGNGAEKLLVLPVWCDNYQRPDILKDPQPEQKKPEPEAIQEAEETINIRAINNRAAFDDSLRVLLDNKLYKIQPQNYDDLFLSDLRYNFDREYTKMYNNNGYIDKEAAEEFDNIWNGSQLVNEFCAFRKDFISSEREAAAFARAARLMNLEQPQK